MPGSSPQVNEWCAYQERKTLPKSGKRPLPASYLMAKAGIKAPEPPPAAPIEVEESTASDTFIGRVRRFWGGS